MSGLVGQNEWERLRRIEEAARLLREAQKSGSAYGMVASRTQDLDLALATVSGEPEVANELESQ